MQKCEVLTTLAAFNYHPGMMNCNSFENKNYAGLENEFWAALLFVFQKVKSI
jgi:hypothetical protein